LSPLRSSRICWRLSRWRLVRTGTRSAHHDADEQSHECAVTLFRSGAADDAAPPPVLTAVTLRCVEVLRMEAAQEVFRARVEGWIRERAPPSGAV